MSLPSDRPGQNVPGPNSQSSFRRVSPGGPDSHEEESLRDVIRVLRKRRPLILAWALSALALAYLYCALVTSQYTSTATLLVDKQGSSGVDAGVSPVLLPVWAGKMISRRS